MDFVSNREPQIEEMLEALGMTNVEELFSSIPEHLRRKRLEEVDGLSELEIVRYFEEVAAENKATGYDSYLGGGAYEHHVPSLVASVTSKSEFLTSYTPYQAEVSQGMLQAIFEFQTCIAALTGMDAANASVFDGANAAAEGLLMTLRAKSKAPRVLIAASAHPSYKAAVKQYVEGQGIEVVEVPYNRDFSLDQKALQELLATDTAGVLVQSPNHFGVIEEMREINTSIHEAGALSVHSANPLSYGLFASAGELGADIAVGDAQPFGLPLQFGGPYVGYVACRQKLTRQLPGRIVGETVDKHGSRGFVLTLQAREQHIRRDKATSNICTNQSLAALACLVAMLWYGKEGVKKLALTNYQRASYLKKQLQNIPGVKLLSSQETFNEFVVSFPVEKELFEKALQEEKILPGLFLPEQKGWLVSVTEMKDIEALTRYVQAVKKVCG